MSVTADLILPKLVGWAATAIPRFMRSSFEASCVMAASALAVTNLLHFTSRRSAVSACSAVGAAAGFAVAYASLAS